MSQLRNFNCYTKSGIREMWLGVLIVASGDLITHWFVPSIPLEQSRPACDGSGRTEWASRNGLLFDWPGRSCP